MDFDEFDEFFTWSMRTRVQVGLGALLGFAGGIGTVLGIIKFMPWLIGGSIMLWTIGILLVKYS